MKNIGKNNINLKNRSGVVLIMAIVLLAGMTMIGTALLLSTNIEIKHSRTTRHDQILFYDTDAMATISFNLVKLVMSQDVGNLDPYLSSSGQFEVTINNDLFYTDDDYDIADDRMSMFKPTDADMVFSVRESDTTIALVKIRPDPVSINQNTNIVDDGYDNTPLTTAFLIRVVGFDDSENIVRSQIKRIAMFYQHVE